MWEIFGGFNFRDGWSLPFCGFDAHTHAHYVLYNQTYFVLLIYAVRWSSTKLDLQIFMLYSSQTPFSRRKKYTLSSLWVHIVSSPDSTLREGKDLVILGQILGPLWRNFHVPIRSQLWYSHMTSLPQDSLFMYEGISKCQSDHSSGTVICLAYRRNVTAL